MATTFVLTRPDVFVSGTVAAYVKPALGVPASGAPSGSAVSSPSVVGNSVTFTGLADNTQYIAYQGSPDRYVSFRTTPASTAVSETDPVAGADLATHEALTTTAHGSVGASLATHAALTTTAHGGLIPNTLLDAKGDLIAASAADTAAKVTVGANGTFLVADSAQTAGVKWVAPTVFGTTLPVSPADGDRYYWNVDAVNGVVWHMIYNAALTKWLFLGGPPLWSQVDTGQTTTSTTYAALATAGPSILIPGVGGGLYLVGIGAAMGASAINVGVHMSYDIGATGAVDADRTFHRSAGTGVNPYSSGSRFNRKTFATAVTLTAKYKVDSATGDYSLRWMSLLPIQVNPS